MLTLLTFIPILGSFILLFFNNTASYSDSASLVTEGKPHQTSIRSYAATNGLWLGYDLRIRQIALIISILTFMFSTLLWIKFDCNMSGFQFMGYWSSGANTYFTARIGIDGIGLIFVLLTTYLMPIAILSTWDSVQHGIRGHLIALLIIEAILIAVFISLDIISFYVTFEAVLIPLYLLVGAHGATDVRLRASFLLFLYTLAGSLFMLLGLIKLLELKGATDLTILSLGPVLNLEMQKWIWLGIFLSLAIKAPLVPVHIWLNRAHAEAPLSTSIVLAGLILKLSTYGFIRLLITLLPNGCVFFAPLTITVSIITIIHGALVTLRQIDSKAYIATSSVSHMGIVMLGLGTGTLIGLQGAMLLSVAHGLVSPALFILVGGVLYDRYHTRIIKYYRGLGSSMPSFKIWFFLASCASMAVPGSLNWVAELLCLTGSFEISPLAGLLAASSVILGAIYTIWIYMNITGGGLSPYLALTPDMTRRERSLLMYLLLPVLAIGIFPNLLLNPLNLALTALII